MKNKKLYLCLIIILIIFFKLFYADSVTVLINSEKIELKRGEDKEIDLITFNNEEDIVIERTFGLVSISVDGKKVKFGKKLNLGKIDITDDSKLVIDVSYINGYSKRYTINTLPSTFPKYLVDGESEYDGDYYMSTYSFDYDDNHYIFKLDKKGNMKFYKKTKLVSFDFRKEKNKNGNIRYTYLEATADNFEGATSILPCDLVILDENYNEIDRVNYLMDDGNYLKLDNHTYIYLDDNHYILTTYVNRKKRLFDKDIYVSDCLIQEVKDGNVIWQFDSGDYSKLYEYSTLETLYYSKPYQDYIHINSMSIDLDDNNLLCSFRNIDSVFKIDRTTGKLIWILGGEGDEFGLTKKQKFSKQHSIISVGNNTIFLYDNGNANKKSRVLKIKLDETNKKIIKYEEYDTELYAFMMGSIRILDEKSNTHLICYGGGNYDKYSVEEINYSTDDVSFKFTFSENKYLYNVNKIK